MHLNNLAAWPQLQALAHQYKAFDLRTAMANYGPLRVDALCATAPHLLVDTAKQAWGPEVLAALCTAAEQIGLPQQRDALLAGSVVNATENRPAVHAHWRLQAAAALRDGTALASSLQAMLDAAEQIRARADIDDVVHIGIGGSSLGPEMVLQALQPFATARQRVHVVSNLDGHDLHQTLQPLNPQRTLLVVVSKSWSTAETLRNAESAIAWLRAGGVADVAAHMVAVSSKPELAQRMGAGTVLDMPDGMGGRYSLWSAVGLPVAVALGAQGFVQLLQGGADMDEHFAQTPLPRNVPVLLGLLDVWNSTFLGLQGRCVAPYHHGLRRLPAYLQQLEMESNGKHVGTDGQPLAYATAGLTWGEEGSNGQHAFFQWLHQGTQSMPLELLLIKYPEHPLPGHHTALLASGLAQAQALLQGQAAGIGQLSGHQDFVGNRASTIIGLERLTPTSLGALLAMYEHRTFVAGVVWGINPFDQFGVELGKTLATQLEPRLQSGNVEGLDASTAHWVQWVRN